MKEESVMRILLLKTWLVNIGNGFIDAGAEALLSNAVPEAEIIDVSGYPDHVGDVNTQFGGLRQKLSTTSQDFRENMLNLAELVDVDIAVLSGCVLYQHALKKYLPTLQYLTKNEIPIIFLGAGGGDYTPETESYVRKTIGDLSVAGLITRDSTAYETYQDLTRSYDGIDCAFWIDQYYKPPDANRKFVTATFDKIDEPPIDTDLMTVRPDHAPFEHPWEYPITDVIKKSVRPSDRFNEENVFMSDQIEDYLFLYANTVESHTDRIHAALPTLVYGNSARFYYDTPRADLFNRVLNEDISAQTVSLDSDALESECEKQESQVHDLIHDTI